MQRRSPQRERASYRLQRGQPYQDIKANKPSQERDRHRQRTKEDRRAKRRRERPPMFTSGRITQQVPPSDILRQNPRFAKDLLPMLQRRLPSNDRPRTTCPKVYHRSQPNFLHLQAWGFRQGGPLSKVWGNRSRLLPSERAKKG